MFKLLGIFASGIFKFNPIDFKKYFKIAIILILVTITVVLSYRIYGSIQNKFKEIENNKLLVQQQAQLLNQQKEELKEMNIRMNNLLSSHEKTIEILSDLSEKQSRINQTINNRKKEVDITIRNIDKESISDQDKARRKSEVLIDDLNATYCELFPINCN